MLKPLAFLILLYFIWEEAEDYLPTSDVHVLSHSVMSDSDSMDRSLPGSSVHGILQVRILEQVAISPPGDLPNPGPLSLGLPASVGGFFTTFFNSFPRSDDCAFNISNTTAISYNHYSQKLESTDHQSSLLSAEGRTGFYQCPMTNSTIS